MISLLDRYRGCLLGLAVGDALGAHCEGKPREYCMSLPSIEMVGSTRHGIKPGQWTDDTSMALCLAQSLLDCDGFDATNQMQKYANWKENGYMGCNNVCIGIGKTTACSIDDWLHFGAGPLDGPSNPNLAGNGSIMRLAPVPLFYYPYRDTAVKWSAISSQTTHGAFEAIGACQLFGWILSNTLAGKSKEDILFNSGNPCFIGFGARPGVEYDFSKLLSIANGDYRSKSITEICGNAYVINSLEAALWCFFTTDSYKDAITLAVRIGDDTDTTAAIVGQLAGAYYGYSAIPIEWLTMIDMNDKIDLIANTLYHRATYKYNLDLLNGKHVYYLTRSIEQHPTH